MERRVRLFSRAIANSKSAYLKLQILAAQKLPILNRIFSRQIISSKVNSTNSSDIIYCIYDIDKNISKTGYGITIHVHTYYDLIDYQIDIDKQFISITLDNIINMLNILKNYMKLSDILWKEQINIIRKEKKFSYLRFNWKC